MKTYRNVVIVVSIILGIFVAMWVRFDSPGAKVAFDQTLPELDYEYLHNMALEIVRGNEPALDKSISAEVFLNDKTVKVRICQEVKGIREFYTLEATFPISETDTSFKDGNVSETFSIDYDKGQYTYYGDHDRKKTIRQTSLILLFVVPFFLFGGLYWVPSEIIVLVKARRYKLREEGFQ